DPGLRDVAAGRLLRCHHLLEEIIETSLIGGRRPTKVARAPRDDDSCSGVAYAAIPTCPASHPSIARLRVRPRCYPVMSPLLPTTRWHGTTKQMGLLRTAE